MPRCSANGIEIEYDAFGDPAAPTMLLVMGLGMQLLGWEPAFCEQLAARGYRVVRFDNRDVGLSTYFDEHGLPNLGAVLGGDASGVPYLLADMADDAAGLLTALGADTAHIVGVSMGGMIVQELALRHPERVLSVSSIMATTGDRTVGQPTPEAMNALMTPPAQDREGAIERGLRGRRVYESPAYPRTDEALRADLGAAYDRAFHPVGTARQLAAIVASPDRTERLRGLSVPTQVIHGEQDTLVDVSGGKATAAAVPGAELLLIPGMGHDLPTQLWDQVIDSVVANAERAV